MRLIVVAGARPNFVKIAPLMWEIADRPDIEASLVHTGQHYDRAMSHLFFEQLGIPEPDENLGVGSGTHASPASSDAQSELRQQLASTFGRFTVDH
ncbi:MAG: UDP-N-acetylglucosamine 2-epimerase [Planctomycetaceae bacterium]|nr:UDP-N-acetylglucosamine 2-epimerase [Planctomycetaceae bacterium]